MNSNGRSLLEVLRLAGVVLGVSLMSACTYDAVYGNAYRKCQANGNEFQRQQCLRDFDDTRAAYGRLRREEDKQTESSQIDFRSRKEEEEQ